MIDTIRGIPVMFNSLMPAKEGKLKLNNKVIVSDGFRRDYNSWLEQFGTVPLIYVMDKGVMGVGNGKVIITHPSNREEIMRAMNND